MFFLGSLRRKMTGWNELPTHVQRRIGSDAVYAMYHAEENAIRRRANRARETARRSSLSASGWVTFARTFFPVVLETEPSAIVKSLVRAVWRDHAASKRDPWLRSHVEGFRDLERAYDEDGYRRVIRFNGTVYESDKRKDMYLEPDHVVRRLLPMLTAEEIGLDKDRRYHARRT